MGGDKGNVGVGENRRANKELRRTGKSSQAGAPESERRGRRIHELWVWRSSSILQISESSLLEETFKFTWFHHQSNCTTIPITHCTPKGLTQTPVENPQSFSLQLRLAELCSNHISDDSERRKPLTRRLDVSQGMSSGSHNLEEKLPAFYHWRISSGKENTITAALNCTERFMI